MELLPPLLTLVHQSVKYVINLFMFPFTSIIILKIPINVTFHPTWKPFSPPSKLHHLNWYPDPGPTHHLTSNLVNLNIHAPRNIQVQIRFKLVMVRAYLSSTLEPSTLYTHIPFLLNNVLYAPQKIDFVQVWVYGIKNVYIGSQER